ncbi:MAG: hypothetical protein HZB54_00780 [Deltaproteobacteria bacterium]|nr:hypothetical protein [Deltaproteobacteria bacterium]
MTSTILFAVFVVIIISSDGFGVTKFGDMVFDDKAGSMKKAGVTPAVFPHSKHEELYKCDICHPKIFKDKRGANDITMQKNIDGKFCGSADCHNSEKAFPLYHCNKCHAANK